MSDAAKKLASLLKRLKPLTGGSGLTPIVPPPAPPPTREPDPAPEVSSANGTPAAAPPETLPPAPVAPPTPEGPTDGERAVHELVYSLLLWEASSTQARAAFRRLREAFVDPNEIRVAMDDELTAVIGEKHPLCLERARRIKAVLNDIFRRFHVVTLQSLVGSAKRDTRALLEQLEGMPSFVAARVALVSLHTHAIPVDERLRDLLAGEGIVDADTSPADASTWLERHISAEEASLVAAALQAWSDEEGTPPKRERKPAPLRMAPAKGADARSADARAAADKDAANADARPSRSTKPARSAKPQSKTPAPKAAPSKPASAKAAKSRSKSRSGN